MHTQSRLVAQYREPSNLNAWIHLHDRFSTNPYPWVHWVFDQFALSEGCHVLDVGCGAGTLWERNADRVPRDTSLILSDFSHGMAETASKASGQLPMSPHAVVCNARCICFAHDTFDVVVANHMLYHTGDVDVALREIRRVLKPGGTLYASTNGPDALKELGEVLPPEIPHKPISDVIGDFTLENGPAKLRRWFPDVELRRFDDSLEVTEAEPLVDYALSRISVFASDTPRESIDRDVAVRHVREIIRSREGRLRITKDGGVLIGTSP